MRKTKITIAAILWGIALTGCAAEAPPAAPVATTELAATSTGGVRREAITTTARVEKVDQKTRKVTLLAHDGQRETITAGPEVKNLAQLRKGDEVVVTYYAAVAFDVLGKGKASDETSAAVGLATAEQGELPGAVAASQITTVVEAVRLDPQKSTATIKLEDGSVETVDIQNPAVFQKVKVGDKVQVRMTEALAIDVRPTGGAR